MSRLPLWAILGSIGAAMFGVGSALQADAADPSVPVKLTFSGDSDIVGELVDWQDTMFLADQPTDVEYFERGSVLSRDNLLEGRSDVAISGVGFTAAELAAHPDKAGKIIELPLSIGSTAIIVTEPNVGWVTRVLPTDPSCETDDPDPVLCVARDVPFTAPIRIAPEPLSALITGLGISYQQNNLINWNSQAMIAGLGVDNLIVQLNNQFDSFVNRTEGASQNLYLKQYAKQLGPVAYGLREQEYPSPLWNDGVETFPPRTLSIFGSTSQQGIIAQPVDALSRTVTGSWAGNMGPIPTTQVADFTRNYPNARIRVVQIQNANGDWVAPTRASLDAALAAGASTPNYATFNPVPGAYPLTFVNHLYTVGGTLDPDEANGLAAAVRYFVTDGQQLVIDDGGTSITAAMRADALAKADQIVVANCTAEGYEVTTSGPTDFEPDTPGVQALSAMKHCTLKPPPPPTTTTTTTTSTTVAPTTTEATTTSTTTTIAVTTTTQSPVLTTESTPNTTLVVAQTTPSPVYVPPRTPTITFDDGGGDTSDTEPTSTEPSSTDEVVGETSPSVESEAPVLTSPPADDAASGGGAGTRVRGISLQKLPMEAPDDGSGGFKKLGTLMMGAALFIFARRLYLARSATT